MLHIITNIRETTNKNKCYYENKYVKFALQIIITMVSSNDLLGNVVYMTGIISMVFITYLSLPFEKQVEPFINTNLKLTLVIMGYSPKRKSNYKKLFTTYGKLDNIINQIIFLWCNSNHSSPEIPVTNVPIRLEQSANSLNSRFNVSHMVTTDAVLILDDDVLLNGILFNQLFDAWKGNPHLLVGIDKRYTSVSGEYRHGPHYPNQQPSITLTKTMMLHRSYLQMYMSEKKILEYVDSKFNGEDIAMNAVVQNHVCASPIFIPLRDENDRITLPEQDALSHSKAGNIWIDQRSSIVKWLKDHFHYDVFNCRSNSYLRKLYQYLL